MVYRGRVRNGVVEFEDRSDLPDGTIVRIEPVESPEYAPGQGHEHLMKLAGVIESKPSDWARNHDHYIHRQPKK